MDELKADEVPSSSSSSSSSEKGSNHTIPARNAIPAHNNPFDDESIGSTNSLQRSLSLRQMQMMAIGGSIGTALFVTIGTGLTQGGPGSLLIAFAIYSCFIACVNNCMAEMAIFMPVPGSFVRMGSKWVDEAFGFMLGWNFFFYEAFLIPWEISALNLILGFWSDDIPTAAVCVVCIVAYGLLNVFAVKWYGEAEFWLSTGKVILVGLVFGFTFVTMVGGNPQHDAYGFRYWKNAGAFAEFPAALWKAAFTIIGPEYIAMMAGEATQPRKNLKIAFKTIYWRFGVFFIGGALCVGIVLPYNDTTLIRALTGASTSSTGGASPYVIAAQNMGIEVLPHIINVLLVTSIFSAGNSYVYMASRTLCSLSLDGHAPKFLRKCNKSGVPLYCFDVTMIFPFISLLSLHSSAAKVINWLASLTEASQIIDFICMCTIYIFFHRALAAQGISRSTLPYIGNFQPYCAWLGLCAMIFTVTLYGYTTFLPGRWSTGDFFSYYTMVFVCPVLYGTWKVWWSTKVVKAEEADLIWDRPEIDAYEANCVEREVGFWVETGEMMGVVKKKEMHVE